MTTCETATNMPILIQILSGVTATFACLGVVSWISILVYDAFIKRWRERRRGW